MVAVTRDAPRTGGDSSAEGRVEFRPLEREMRESFIDYSMSVIVQRALPDARDGLKPVHRRILHAMAEKRLTPGGHYQKSATVVGDVLGRYHPHGDSAVYDAMVRMAQDFSLRYPLVDGQGNFGSLDGDSAAAYRYTEVRMTPAAVEMLSDLEKDTVGMRPNFDGRLEEPEVLPARLPNLLLNGSDGIAVGMATKIPPHNAGELLRAADRLIEAPDIEVDELLELIPGPDFPTGGYIWGKKGIESAYRTGRGRIEMRARLHVEEGKFGKSSLVVTELPYQVNKARVIGQITNLARLGGTDAITNLRDESDRDGVRLVIELKRDADPAKILELLFRKTQLRCTFGVIMLALVDGAPRELDLRAVLNIWIGHRLEVIRRAAAFDLANASARRHVVEALLKALDTLDEVIAVIRGSRTPASARPKLQRLLGIDAAQADAILAMRLASLTGLEKRKLQEELAELDRRIKFLSAIVRDETVRRERLRAEIAELTEAYQDPRRTQILDGEKPQRLQRGAAEESRLVMLTRQGMIKAQPHASGAGAHSALPGAYALSKRPGDFVLSALACRSFGSLLAVSARGTAYALPLSDLPAATRSSRGRHMDSYLEVAAGDEIVSVMPVDKFEEDRWLVTASRRGKVKRTSLADYENARTGGIIGAGVPRGDEIVSVFISSGGEDLVFFSRLGHIVRFAEDSVRPTGRTAGGVRAMRIEAGNAVVAALPSRPSGELVLLTSKGWGRAVQLESIRRLQRGAKGVRGLANTKRTGILAGVVNTADSGQVAWEFSDGTLGTTALPASGTGSASGVKMIEPPAGHWVEAAWPLRSLVSGSLEGNSPDPDDDPGGDSSTQQGLLELDGR